MADLWHLPLWQQLKQHQQRLAAQPLARLFSSDPHRGSRFAATGVGIYLDYAKNHLDDAAWETLVQLAIHEQIPMAIKALQQGEYLNVSEQRPALHSALRQTQGEVTVDGQNIMPLVQATLAQMHHKISQLHASDITDIINIGIGGSDLGPVMATDALQEFAVTRQRVHFISTLDANQISRLLPTLNPAHTLIIISSKSFTTQETLVNAQIARDWLGKSRWAAQCWAVTAHPAKAAAFGIARENIFPFWQWVGGRYSLWSAIGLPLAILIGMENFQHFLAGGHAMDIHAAQTPLEKNLPVILALLNVWYSTFWAAQTRAILPYDVRLTRFPAYLQQLEMESNGKSIQQDQTPVTYPTCPVVWGEIGTNGQHAFHQLLHQGTLLVPVDFIISRQVPHAWQDQHRQLWSHCLSQAQVLMTGHQAEEPYRHLPGNHPSSMIVLPTLDPYTLGALVALYEYKVFVSARLWHINPFDQWGVEWGKQMATQLYMQLQNGIVADNIDSSTANLLRLFLNSP